MIRNWCQVFAGGFPIVKQVLPWRNLSLEMVHGEIIRMFVVMTCPSTLGLGDWQKVIKRRIVAQNILCVACL